jgi:short-subunit dehydrogenase
MYTYTGKTALITGASSGIGAAFASMLGGLGMQLVLVARSEEKLRKLATQLADKNAVRVEVIAIDLSRAGAAREVFEATQRYGLTVDMLVNNAGFGTYGNFHTIDAEREQQEIMLNVAAVVDLCHQFLPAMVERGDGAIINIASTAAFQPVPFEAVYGASKAFVLSFSEALWVEYRGKGVRVLALCPGATATEFFAVLGTENAAVGAKETPEKVVRTGLRALERGRLSVISGASNTLLATMTRFAPRALVAQMAARAVQPRKR